MNRNSGFHPWRLPEQDEGFDYYIDLFTRVEQGFSFRIPGATIETMKQCGPVHQWGTFTWGLCHDLDHPVSQASVTACVMTRNAAATLEPCLRSLRPWADEIIVLDSGSDDGTEEIARQYSDRFLFRAWPDSYADQRNHLISLVRTEWMVMIDADEVLQDGFTTRLKRLFTFADREAIDVLWLPRFWVMDFEEHPDPRCLDAWCCQGHWLFYPDPQARVARMAKRPFYRGALHEELHLEMPGSALLIGIPNLALVHLRLVGFPFGERKRVVAKRNLVDPGGVHNLQLLPELENPVRQKRILEFQDRTLCSKVAGSGKFHISP